MMIPPCLCFLPPCCHRTLVIFVGLFSLRKATLMLTRKCMFTKSHLIINQLQLPPRRTTQIHRLSAPFVGLSSPTTCGQVVLEYERERLHQLAWNRLCLIQNSFFFVLFFFPHLEECNSHPISFYPDCPNDNILTDVFIDYLWCPLACIQVCVCVCVTDEFAKRSGIWSVSIYKSSIELFSPPPLHHLNLL